MLYNVELSKFKIHADTKLKHALSYLDQNKLRFLLCIDTNGRLAGVFTPGDLNRWLIADGNHSLDVSIFEVCQHNPLYVREGAKPREIQALLEKVAYVPIVDEENRPVALAMRRHLQKGLQLGERQIGKEQPVFVIAEIGNNHNGSLDLAKRLIDQAHASGADCAKFQMRDLESLYANAGNSADARENLGSQYTLDLLARFQLSPDEMFQAFDHCKSLGLIPLCTPWDEVSIAHLEEYGVPGYKVASADLTNHSLLRALTQTHKPLICSTGMSREAEIKETVDLFQNHGATYALLHCNSTYPAPFKDVHLKYMERLRELGNCEVGYSGHERGIFVSVAAVARGARIIEKHFTLDRSMEGNDHKVSLLPDEFRKMVEGIRQVDEALGQGETRELSQGEMMNRVTLAKSVFVNCDVAKGEKIEKEMLVVKSPGHGLQPNRLIELVGRQSPRSLRAGDVFYPTDLEEERPEPRKFSFQSRWGLPVRHHDYRTLFPLSNPKVLEFHLSYKDLELDHASFFPEQVPVDLIVHAPELFAGDHTLDLASPDEGYRKESIRQMRRVIEVTKALRPYFMNANQSIGIITNVGGFSQDSPLSSNEIKDCRARLRESLSELNDAAVQIWPQTMPPFPWHFGGQRFHNLFVDVDEIVEFCLEMTMRVCLDISHSKLACNHNRQSFQLFLEKVLPLTAHLHIADSAGVDGEGLQIEEGEIDFYALGEAMQEYAPQASWIPEIWQGHENQGEGFWRALERLEKHQVY
jgi:sialic acid synthase SpsE/sugar phosphate isomerase/epimerase